MGWYYRHPSTFPASFAQALRTAAASPSEASILGAAASYRDIQNMAEQFRWWKWCVKHEPGTWVHNTLRDFDVRTKVEEDAVGFLLYLTVKPTKISEFIRLNPDLADEILPQCQ